MNSCLCVANYWFPQNQQFATHRVIALDKDDAQYLEFMRQPHFHNNQIGEAFDKEKVLDMFEQIFSARIQPVGARRSFFFLGHRALDKLETWQLAQRKF